MFLQEVMEEGRCRGVIVPPSRCSVWRAAVVSARYLRVQDVVPRHPYHGTHEAIVQPNASPGGQTVMLGLTLAGAASRPNNRRTRHDDRGAGRTTARASSSSSVRSLSAIWCGKRVGRDNRCNSHQSSWSIVMWEIKKVF